MVFWHMMDHNLFSEMIKHIKIFILVLILLPSESGSQTREICGTGEFMDGIAAIVNDGVVLRSEVEDQALLIIKNIERQGGQLPSLSQVREEVLERLILQRIQLQRAE